MRISPYEVSCGCFWVLPLCCESKKIDNHSNPLYNFTISIKSFPMKFSTQNFHRRFNCVNHIFNSLQSTISPLCFLFNHFHCSDIAKEQLQKSFINKFERFFCRKTKTKKKSFSLFACTFAAPTSQTLLFSVEYKTERKEIYRFLFSFLRRENF